jgi:hypothetical protein
VAEGGVYGVHQIEAGIDQRAVEIEDYELDCVWVECAQSTNHVLLG